MGGSGAVERAQRGWVVVFFGLVVLWCGIVHSAMHRYARLVPGICERTTHGTNESMCRSR